MKIKEYKAVSPEPVPPGERSLSVRFTPTERSEQPPFYLGDVTIFVDDKPVGKVNGIKMAGQYSAATGYSLTIGRNIGTPVSHDYEVPFGFTGELHKVTIDIPKQSE